MNIQGQQSPKGLADILSADTAIIRDLLTKKAVWLNRGANMSQADLFFTLPMAALKA